MTLISDPDLLNQGVEVDFLTGSLSGSADGPLIRLNTTGNLSTDGVTMQALYSFVKEEWKDDENLIKFPIPILAITSEQFELINTWDLSGSFSKYLIRDGGWALKDALGGSREEWMNITTLGSFQDSNNDLAYFLQFTGSFDTPENFQLTGPVNQGVQIYSSGSINFDYRDVFKVYLREQGKTYGFYDLLTEQNLSTLTSRKFALPLSNALDTKITESDATITGSAPYDNMSITYFTSSFQRSIGGTNYDFKVLIDGNSGTLEEIYEFVQFQLRQTGSIDAGDNVASGIRGDIAQDLLTFVGDTLFTQRVSYEGVTGGTYIDGFQAADTNDLRFTDDSGIVQQFPFVAAGTIVFNDNLQNDSQAIYKVFFTNADGYENAGSDFGTENAIIINDSSGPNPITGSVGTSASVQFDYDFDNNIQRGDSSSGSVVPFTAVALGLTTAQYVVATGNINRSTANTINLVAALERNYLNPA
jgi:hypothetical protein